MSTTVLPPSGTVRVLGPTDFEAARNVLTADALRLLGHLATTFEPRRQALLRARAQRAEEIDGGHLPHFLEETAAVREAEWKVAPPPEDVLDRRVEITGPVDRKMVINGLNSGARVYMADFEDSTSPTWWNLVDGQNNLRDAVRGTISFQAKGKTYRLNSKTATLFVRPRGLHLDEAHMTVDGQALAGCLMDLGLYIFHNAATLLTAGGRKGVYLYLPKMEGHLEARWWDDVLAGIEDYMGLTRGTVRATVLIETITAAFEMDEILYELRDHSLGLNCGRWDYCFSFIKRLKAHRSFLTPDRKHLTMATPFMQAYVRLLIHTCHRRGTFAMGGMAAQIPIKGGGPEAEQAMASVRADKLREVVAGHDGTWVAGQHPGLVALATEVFDSHMPGPNQIHHLLPALERPVTAQDLLQPPTEGSITLAGLRENVSVCLQYTKAWVAGVGCIPLHNKMEDAATAEISRVQVYQWVRHGATTVEGEVVTSQLVSRVVEEEAAAIARQDRGSSSKPLAIARAVVGRQMTSSEGGLADFLTLDCYPHLTVTKGTPARL